MEALARRVCDGLYRSRHRLATIAICLLAAWLAFRVISGPNGWVVYHQKKAENRQLQVEVQRLQKENEDLERRINALKNDPKAIEKEAREQLRYARPGEVVYVMPEQRPSVVQSQNGIAQKTKP
jgi:cell division protein FtsB